MDAREYISDLLRKHLNDTQTDFEYTEMLKYFDTHPKDAQELLSDLLSTMDPPEISQERMDRVTENAYHRFKKRIKVSYEQKVWPVLKYAAVLVAISIITVMLYNRNSSIEVNSLTLTSNYGDDLLPAKNRATLILSSGRSIPLNEQSSGITISENGISYENGDWIDSSPQTEYAELNTPSAGQYKIILDDGTKVSLNAGSSLRYPIHFNGDNRNVILTGEAYFEVSKDAKRPFIISTVGQKIKVLGTSFNVRAYSRQEVVTLTSGKVSLENYGTKPPTVITPGQQAILVENGIMVRAVDPDDFSAWKQGSLIGAGMDFKEVATELERWYDVKFIFPQVFRNSTKANLNIDMTQRLSVVLKYLGGVYNIDFQIKGKEVIIR